MPYMWAKLREVSWRNPPERGYTKYGPFAGRKGMKCPFCKKDHDKVVDSRTASDGHVVRRRRECLECKRRFTTYERIEDIPVRVVKKDSRRVPFDRKKVLNGIIKACEKRPISVESMEKIVDTVESEIHSFFDREVPSKFIGEMVMKDLRVLDQVAYVRFASVYRAFKDVNEFFDELKPMLSETEKNGGRKIKG